MQYICRISLANVPSIIVCCFILHNVAKFLQDEDFPEVHDEADEENSSDEEERIHEREIQAKGREKREEIAAIIEHQE